MCQACNAMLPAPVSISSTSFHLYLLTCCLALAVAELRTVLETVCTSGLAGS